MRAAIGRRARSMISSNDKWEVPYLIGKESERRKGSTNDCHYELAPVTLMCLCNGFPWRREENRGKADRRELLIAKMSSAARLADIVSLLGSRKYLDEWCNSSLWKVSLRSLSHLVSTTYEASVLREWIDRYWRTYKMDKCAMIIWNITPIGSTALMKNDVLRLWLCTFVHWIMKEKRVSLLDDVDVCLSLYSINHWINRQRRRRMWHIIR